MNDELCYFISQKLVTFDVDNELTLFMVFVGLAGKICVVKFFIVGCNGEIVGLMSVYCFNTTDDSNFHVLLETA